MWPSNACLGFISPYNILKVEHVLHIPSGYHLPIVLQDSGAYLINEDFHMRKYHMSECHVYSSTEMFMYSGVHHRAISAVVAV